MTGHGLRRRGLVAAAALAPLAAPAFAQGRRPHEGTTINVSCWSAPYSRYLADYLPEFTESTGIRVTYDTPGFAIYNQRADLELSTRGSAFDVLNVTFIYTSRWINAGWFTPLDAFVGDPNRTPAGWDFEDFDPGTVQPMRDRAGRVHAVPWTADAMIAGASRFDLFRAAGFERMPDTFEELERSVAAVHDRDGVAGFVTENIYGWTLVPFIQGFGGGVFRDPPNDLYPTLDSPEVAQAAEFLARLIRQHGPAQAVGFNFDAVTNAMRLGRVNYAPHNHAYLMQLGDPGVRTRETVNFGLVPAGPRGRFPSLSSHGWGIPAGARHKDAAWEFIRWSLSKELLEKMVREKGYGSVTRRSIAESPTLRERMTINGVDTVRLFGETLATAAQGHMAYRTVHVYPQVNAQINQAMERVVSGQMGARESFQQAQRNSIADLRRAGVRF